MEVAVVDSQNLISLLVIFHELLNMLNYELISGAVIIGALW